MADKSDKKKKEKEELTQQAEKEEKSPDSKAEKSSKENKKQEKKEKKASEKSPSSGNKKKKPSGKKNHNIKEIDRKTFKSAPPLDKNPIINILDQHKDHRLRIAKIIAGIAILFILIFLFGLAYDNWEQQRKQEKAISDIGKKIALYQEKSSKNTGFIRNQAIAQAILWTHIAQRKDYNHANKWRKKREELFSQLDKVVPKFSKNFVVPTSATDMIAIPKGEFMMGRTVREVNGNSDELPQRKVKITYPFWMARTEIPVYQYKVIFPQYTTKKWDGYPFNLPGQPAVKVTWHNAERFCKDLTFKEKKAGRLPEGYIYRLPTEAEWEYACRAGTDTYFYWGNEFGKAGAKFANALDRRSAKYLDCPIYQESPERDGNYVTAPVGSYKPNAFGLYDMSGNVWEWCLDWYNNNAYRELPDTDPVQLNPVVTDLTRRGNFERIYHFKSTSKVIRGGGCLSPPVDCRSASRDSLVPEKDDYGVGFRIVLAPLVETLNSEKK